MPRHFVEKAIRLSERGLLRGPVGREILAVISVIRRQTQAHRIESGRGDAEEQQATNAGHPHEISELDNHLSSNSSIVRRGNKSSRLKVLKSDR